MLANTHEGFQTLIELLAKYDQPQVVLEASGGDERGLTDAVHDAGITVSVDQPGCMRHFARSLKVLAKTDAIDATVIARFGEATHPAPSEKTSPTTRRLRALADRRPQPQESGAWTGIRRIYGGRASVRKALIMAAKSAARHCPHLAPLYKRLREEGKKAYHVAIIAIARTLLIRLNTLLESPIIPTPNAALAT